VESARQSLQSKKSRRKLLSVLEEQGLAGTALVQMVLGMVRNQKRTLGYRLMQRYRAMKKVKGSGRSMPLPIQPFPLKMVLTSMLRALTKTGIITM
jgi:hypothetical protein